MKSGRIILLVVAIVSIFALLVNCVHSIDLKKEQESLMDADLRYSDLSSEKGMNAAFLEMFDSAGVILRRNHYPVEGIDAVKKLLGSENDTSFTLTWKPIMARIAASGELGYTYGTYTIIARTTGLKEAEGTYVTIWGKTKKEGWKALLDTGNPGLTEPTN